MRERTQRRRQLKLNRSFRAMNTDGTVGASHTLGFDQSAVHRLIPLRSMHLRASSYFPGRASPSSNSLRAVTSA